MTLADPPIRSTPVSPVGTVGLDADHRQRICAAAADALAGTARYVTATADHERTDRLWPADAMVFRTNPMSLAFGACGPALFLHHPTTPVELPVRSAAWLLDQPLDVDAYPPGLYSGLAGIACAFQELGMPEKAKETMLLAYRSPLLHDETNILVGSAGWGLAGLHLYLSTGEPVFLERSVDAGNHLLDSAQREGDTCHWGPDAEGRMNYGYGYGAAGRGLFLLYLYAVTGDDRYRDTAIRAVDYDLAHRVEGPLGWNWQRYEGDSMIRPYWIHGGAGIGSVLVRFHHVLGDERFLVAAQRIAQDGTIKFTVEPGLFEGLAGIAELMTDLYVHTGVDAYHDIALDMAESVLWFRVDRPEGVAWPGRWLRRISNDYATGAAGIGLFLGRLLAPGPRLLMDLPSR